MNRAGSLFESHMLAQDAEGVAIEKWMTENGLI